MTSDPRDVIRYGQLIERLLRITGVDRPEHLAAAVQNLATAFRTSTPVGPDPLVLTLPEVPKEAVALVGVESGRRWVPYSGPLADQSPRQWEERNGESFTGRIRDDAGVLFEEGSVTVELAPPREPRTWEQLDGAPDDVRCVQVAGQLWDREAPLSARRWRKRGTTERETWSQLRARGEVREVLGDA